MSLGTGFIVAGIVIVCVTFKRPAWLGGPARRFDTSNDANAIITRSSARTLGCWLIFAGSLLYLVGL
ncbi:MAG: hypothetical protein ACODAC_01720 [Pseudomonadota bacterium]